MMGRGVSVTRAQYSKAAESGGSRGSAVERWRFAVACVSRVRSKQGHGHGHGSRGVVRSEWEAARGSLAVISRSLPTYLETRIGDGRLCAARALRHGCGLRPNRCQSSREAQLLARADGADRAALCTALVVVQSYSRSASRSAAPGLGLLESKRLRVTGRPPALCGWPTDNATPAGRPERFDPHRYSFPWKARQGIASASTLTLCSDSRSRWRICPRLGI